MPHHRFALAAAALILLGCIRVSPVGAQALGRIEQTETNVNSYYHFAERGTATIKVNVIGSVASPGIYEVSDGTNVETLLVLSGPSVGRQSDRGSGRQTVLVRLYRKQADGRELVYEANLSEDVGDGTDPPILQENDLLMVEVTESRIDWRDVLRIAQTVAVIGLAIDRFARAF